MLLLLSVNCSADYVSLPVHFSVYVGILEETHSLFPKQSSCYDIVVVIVLFKG